MDIDYADKYSFSVEWYEENSNLIRPFYLFYFPYDGSIELYDVKSRKTFLRRTVVEGITKKDLYVGGKVNVYGRLMKIVDFACEDTRRKLASKQQRVFGLIKPLENEIVGDIVTMIYESGLRIAKMKKCKMNRDDIENVFPSEARDASFPFLCDYIFHGYCYGLEIVGDNGIDRWLQLMRDPDSSKAAPNTIRGRFGFDSVRNCVDGFNKPEMIYQALNYMFPETKSHQLPLTATLSNCTLCIVKPHAIAEGNLGKIIREIDIGGFQITALIMCQIEKVNAGEFLEVYKGIVSEYKAMVDELGSGACVAMEIVSKQPNVNTPVEFRKLVGPVDPEVAKLLRPDTIRAKFGKTKVQNAVHCSDLPEDGLLEVEYFFKILNM